MKAMNQEIFMDTKYITSGPRTFHIHHPWAKQPSEDLAADYNNFQDIVNASLKTLQTARLASVEGHVLGRAWVLHPPGTEFPSGHLFPEDDKTGHEQPEAQVSDPPSFMLIGALIMTSMHARFCLGLAMCTPPGCVYPSCLCAFHIPVPIPPASAHPTCLRAFYPLRANRLSRA